MGWPTVITAVAPGRYRKHRSRAATLMLKRLHVEISARNLSPLDLGDHDGAGPRVLHVNHRRRTMLLLQPAAGKRRNLRTLVLHAPAVLTIEAQEAHGLDRTSDDHEETHPQDQTAYPRANHHKHQTDEEPRIRVIQLLPRRWTAIKQKHLLVAKRKSKKWVFIEFELQPEKKK
eukprot:CAMPEP_0178993736 /NCGR_PEP_ID=MMETSP0795-20121207/6874_1 /TAXON_ID=88552 /ORGANISM="Amoebophrya sp., Strain Ameob2" /LENGTH=173 /DNA_ID=CAMNT_0020685839 /DNA_START=622 /DNA_END=1145 /DNA_ORIENTATION=+